MINIILKNNENGYDEVGKVVDKFVEKYGVGNIVVTLILKYTPNDLPYISNELLLFEGFNSDDQSPITPHEGFIWNNDWWEGQKYIDVVAIDFIDDIIISRYKLRRMEIEKRK